jgi:hypothetical protein
MYSYSCSCEEARINSKKITWLDIYIYAEITNTFKKINDGFCYLLNFKVYFLESIVINFLVFVLSDVVRNFM